MHFRIADTFTDSLANLTGDEQKAVKTTAFDLQMNPANPGMQFHRLNGARDPNFWSIRVNRDIRLIVHRTPASLLLCYVDHHDKAYHWAERRKLEAHPKTGAAQLIEIRETVREIVIPAYTVADHSSPAKRMLFDGISKEDLLGYGIPSEWIDDVRQADEDSLLELTDHLPSEAAEALLELATGGQPHVSVPATDRADPFEHPDAQRRFRIMADADELARALDFPWEKWTIFLHPAQQQIVEKHFNGPARVSGSAGTGKTIVALHRAVHLAKSNPEARILLTTFSDTLANSLRLKLKRLISNQPKLAERLEVHAIDEIGKRLYAAHYAAPTIASREQVQKLLNDASDQAKDFKVSPRFLLGEWENVVDAWQLQTWEDYRDVLRLGRKTRLPEQKRAALWSIFELVKARLSEQSLVTMGEMFHRLAESLRKRRNPPYDFAVVDEAQDISVAQLRFMAALGGDRPNALFFAGDLGQRIFQTPFSWKSLGVDVRGRSHTLRINYRTSHQIRMQADRLLGPEIADVDRNVEERRDTVSTFNGPNPDIRVLESNESESDVISAWLGDMTSEGIAANEIGVFVRSAAQLDRAENAVKQSGMQFHLLDQKHQPARDRVSIGTMHLAKGLEFRAVAVMACDDEVIPLQERMESVADDADLEDIYNTERQLLYVACTRAREHLMVTGTDPASEFLDDLNG